MQTVHRAYLSTAMESVALSVDNVALQIGREASSVQQRLLFGAWTLEQRGGESIALLLAIVPGRTEVVLPVSAVLVLPLLFEVPGQRHRSRPERRRILHAVAQRRRIG